MKKLLFTDAIIHTGSSETETFSSMLVENGVITALDPSAAPGAKRISMNGAHVYPCLIDGHTHLLNTVVMASGFTVCNIEHGRVEPHDISGVKDKICAFAREQKKNSLVVGTNYIPSAIDERRLPTKDELDEWCGGRPVVIYTIDGHASSLSTAMMLKLGIDPDGHDGILIGEAHERIQGRVTDTIAASVTPALLAKGVANFHNACATYGISAIGALEGNGDSEKDPTTALIVRLARHFDVAVRVYFQYIDIKKALPYVKYQKRPRIGGCGDWEMDGACGAHSAAYALPYRDTGLTAPLYYEQEFVDRTVKECSEAGFQISCHAIGDLAIERIVSALCKTDPTCPHRIEHCEFATDEDLERIARRGFILMMQPGYSWVDKRYLHTYEQHLPDELIARLKFKTLIDMGITVCGSSDSPVQELDPWLQIMGMTQFYHEEESISAYQAFRCYTANSAKALLEEDERGTLTVGRVADFFTSDKNIFELSPEELGSFRPDATYYAGVPAKRWRGTVGELIGMMLKKPRAV